MVAAQWQGEEKSYFRFERFIIFDKKRPGKARPLGHMAEKGRGVLLFSRRGFTLNLQDVLLFHFVKGGCAVSGIGNVHQPYSGPRVRNGLGQPCILSTTSAV